MHLNKKLDCAAVKVYRQAEHELNGTTPSPWCPHWRKTWPSLFVPSTKLLRTSENNWNFNFQVEHFLLSQWFDDEIAHHLIKSLLQKSFCYLMTPMHMLTNTQNVAINEVLFFSVFISIFVNLALSGDYTQAILVLNSALASPFFIKDFIFF